MAYPTKRELRVLAGQLADEAGVPRNNRQEFANRLVEIVLDLRKSYRGMTASKAVIEAAKAAGVLDRKFSRVKQPDREWVEKFKTDHGVVFAAGEIGDVATTITNVAILLHDALGKSYRPSLPRQMRVNKGRVNDQRLRDLVFGLLSAASANGGRFTFNKNSTSGTLAVALDRLRRHLPPQLVPNPLHATTVQRLISEFNGQPRL
jgi:hypothetical protein